MSKAADENWGMAWSRETEMECGIAMQHLAATVWTKWAKAFSANQYPNMVGLGDVHDTWNMMYQDMKALYTLETLVNDNYKSVIVEKDGPGMTNQARKIVNSPAINQRWNPVIVDSEGVVHGLPGDDGKYLMTDGKDIWIDDYTDGVDDGVWLDSGANIQDIKAWMEMPDVP
ncbi:MAG: hypothetical protein IKE08_04130 [Clostridia bacterium]|nr:hypothetical protein [Clostridia bacterium]